MMNKRVDTMRIEMNEVPPSVNHIWKHRICGNRAMTYLTKEGKEFKDRISALVPKDHKPFRGDVSVYLLLVFPDKRRRDIDNYCKGILDGMNHKVYLDDSQIKELYVRKEYDKNKPKIIVYVDEIEPPKGWYGLI